MSRFVYPVNSPVTQMFGARPAYYKQFGQLGHNGTDFGCPTGTPVKAAADGVIFFEGDGGALWWVGSIAGIYVAIDHGDMYTGYAHLGSTIVDKGQSVKQGQIIGYSDSTGTVDGPHLHFEFIAKPINKDNGYYGRINPTLVDLGNTGGTSMTDRPTLDLIYAGVLGRPRGDGEGENVYLNKDTNWVIKDIFNSQEANIRRAQVAAQANTVAQLQASVSDLSTRPTRDEYKQALDKATAESQTIQDLQKQLQDAQNTPPVVVEKPVESKWKWLTDILDALFKKK